MRSRIKLPLEELAPVLVPWPKQEEPLDLPLLFGNDHPVELEVGFGKGAFLVESSQARPEINFLGIEIDKGLQLYVATRLIRRGISHAKVMQGDAGRLLSSFLRSGVLDAIHVYFPDPWWKKRHKKRRVFNEAFVTQAARVLKPGGQLYIATDVAEYFQVMLGILSQHLQFEILSADRTETRDPTLPMTNFERKAMAVNRPVWRAVARTQILLS